MRTGTLRLLAFSGAAHTLAFLTHIQRVGKNLPIHKHAVFEEAIFDKEEEDRMKMNEILAQVLFYEETQYLDI